MLVTFATHHMAVKNMQRRNGGNLLMPQNQWVNVRVEIYVEEVNIRRNGGDLLNVAVGIYVNVHPEKIYTNDAPLPTLLRSIVGGRMARNCNKIQMLC